MEGDESNDKDNTIGSPTNSQQTDFSWVRSKILNFSADTPEPVSVSDDDEIDYSIKPEFYDSDLDDKDEKWMHKQRGGRTSDAILSCPGCFTTVCLECQRHETYVTQYRAVFVVNCKVHKDRTFQQSTRPSRKGGKRSREPREHETSPAAGETFNPVCCSICSTEIGVIDEDEIYHFFNVIPSES